MRNIQDFWGDITQPITSDLLEYYGLDPSVYGADRGYTVATSRNVGTATITGTEFEYRQNLNFLPGWARGLNVFANMTLQDLSGNPEANFTGFIERTINYGVAFSRSRFTGRVNVNLRGREKLALFTGAGVEPGTYNYRAPNTFMDCHLEFRFTKRIAIYGTGRNLLNEYKLQERYGPSAPAYARLRSAEDTRRQFTFGVRGSF